MNKETAMRASKVIANMRHNNKWAHEADLMLIADMYTHEEFAEVMAFMKKSSSLEFEERDGKWRIARMQKDKYEDDHAKISMFASHDV